MSPSHEGKCRDFCFMVTICTQAGESFLKLGNEIRSVGIKMAGFSLISPNDYIFSKHSYGSVLMNNLSFNMSDFNATK